MGWLSPLWEHPGRVLAALLVVSLLALAGMVDLETGEPKVLVDPSVDRMLPAGGRDREVYEHARKLFGSDEAVVVALGSEDVFSAEMLERIVRLTETLESLDGVQRVLSLATAINIQNRDGDLRIAPFLDVLPADEDAREYLRNQATQSPIYGGELVSVDSRTTALLVYLDRLSDRELIERRIVPNVEATVRAEVGDGEVWFSGPPYIKAAGSDIILAELSYMLPGVMVVLGIILFLSLRSVRGVVIPLTTILVSLLWTLGILGWLGQTLDLVTSVVPALILTVGFAYAIHVASRYHEEFEAAAGDEELPAPTSSREAVRATVAHVTLPIVVTGITTASGFLALALNPIVAVRQFGLFSMLGVVCAVIATLTVGPALFALLPAPRPSRPSGFAARLDQVGAFMARHTVGHRRRQVAIWGAVLVLALLAATQLRVGTEVMTGFSEDLPVRQGYNAINERLGGANELQILLESDVTEAFRTPSYLTQLEELQVWLEEQPEIGSVQSIVDYLKLLNRAIHDDDPAYQRIPETKRIVSQLMFFGASPETQRFLDARSQIANIRVRAKVGDTDSIAVLVSRIEERIGELPSHVRGTVTGSIAMLSSSVNEVSRGQQLSLGVAFALIFGVLSLTFMSVRVGLIALFPNVLPVAVYFGALGVTGVTLNSTTSLVACLALGIAVDDTIHFFVRFNQVAQKVGDELKAAAGALHDLIRPVSFTTLGLCLGFLVLTSSQIKGQVEFGLLASLTLAVAWLVDVTLTPALCSDMKIVTLWNVLTLDLGAHPQRTIPLFAGLSDRQTRLVALTMDMVEAPQGTRLMTFGEEGRDMFVILDGDVSCSIERGGERVELVKLNRGHTVGEVGHLTGTRSADVDAITDVRLLRFDAEDLESLRRHRPRAAALVYRNLSGIQAGRMARSAQQVR